MFWPFFTKKSFKFWKWKKKKKIRLNLLKNFTFFDWLFFLSLISIGFWIEMIIDYVRLVYPSGPLVWLTGLDQSPTGIFAWERKKEGKKATTIYLFAYLYPLIFIFYLVSDIYFYLVNVPNFAVHTKFVGTQ